MAIWIRISYWQLCSLFFQFKELFILGFVKRCEATEEEFKYNFSKIKQSKNMKRGRWDGGEGEGNRI